MWAVKERQERKYQYSMSQQHEIKTTAPQENPSAEALNGFSFVDSTLVYFEVCVNVYP